MPHRTSSLVQFDDCPAKYALLRDNPDIENTSTAMERGTAVHKAAEVYLTGIYEGKPDASAILAAHSSRCLCRAPPSGHDTRSKHQHTFGMRTRASDSMSCQW